MCGRYNFTVEQREEMREILKKLNKKFPGKSIKEGDIYPTDEAPMLIGNNDKIETTLGSWGYPKIGQKGVLINARGETAFEKPTFRESTLYRRCIIPSSGFYEWNEEKKKFWFQMKNERPLYMAGLYNYYNDAIQFVILTTPANASMWDIHDRMPLVVPWENLEDWIFNTEMSHEFLYGEPPLLQRTMVG